MDWNIHHYSKRLSIRYYTFHMIRHNHHHRNFYRHNLEYMMDLVTETVLD